jgi:hypothetical protein
MTWFDAMKKSNDAAYQDFEYVKPTKEWVGLTNEEVRYYAEQHSNLVNAHYDKALDTNIVTETFSATDFYQAIEAKLKEKNT